MTGSDSPRDQFWFSKWPVLILLVTSSDSHRDWFWFSKWPVLILQVTTSDSPRDQLWFSNDSDYDLVSSAADEDNYSLQIMFGDTK